ncbi:MAG: hypothetical protein AAGE94_11965 [Acidobacteriota bacterium]
MIQPSKLVPAPLTAAVLALGVGLFTTGCASVGPVRDQCARIAVDPAPTWTAAASWTGRGDRLLLVDPGIRGLLAFDLDGRLIERVEDPDLAALDYTLPIRVEPAGRSAVIGDRTGVHALRRRGVSTVFDEVPGVDQVFLGDWTLIDDGDEWVGYADMTLDDETWRQGFVRVDRDGSIERLLDFPIEAGGEFLSYHNYNQRPYVARLDDEVYVLRYTEPVSLSRVVDGGLDEIWRAEDDDTLRYAAVIAWDDALYLVSRRKIETAVGVEEPTAPKPIAVGGQLQLQAMTAVQTTSRWELVRLDPDSGKITWRRPLPTERRPLLAPGPHAWAMIEGGSRPTARDEDGEPTWLTLVPTERFGAEAPPRFCDGPTPVRHEPVQHGPISLPKPIPATPGAK